MNANTKKYLFFLINDQNIILLSLDNKFKFGNNYI